MKETTTNLVIFTAYDENYGAHNWEAGDGPCPQHWKCKGGDDFIFEIPTSVMVDHAIAGTVKTFVEGIIAKHDLEHSSEYSTQRVIDWELTDEYPEHSFAPFVRLKI